MVFYEDLVALVQEKRRQTFFTAIGNLVVVNGFLRIP